MRYPFEIIRKPILTPKAIQAFEKKVPEYTFEVALNATKPQIKQALEEGFNIKVAHVRTSINHRDAKRMGRFTVERSNFKKAFFVLAAGHRLPLVEEVLLEAQASEKAKKEQALQEQKEKEIKKKANRE
jgi:large subunit ribosomal protein L23